MSKSKGRTVLFYYIVRVGYVAAVQVLDAQEMLFFRFPLAHLQEEADGNKVFNVSACHGAETIATRCGRFWIQFHVLNAKAKTA